MVDEMRITTAAGIPVGDNQNSLTAGPRGPLLVQDWQLFEKHAHFNRERIPERVVHAKGSGAYGTLTVTGDITQYTKADLFSDVGKQTSVFLPVLHRGRRAGRRRRRARRPRLRNEVLHPRGELGPRRQQHPCLLRARPLQVPRLHPLPEARPKRPTSATLPPCGTSGPSSRRACTRSQCSSPTAAFQSRTVT